MSLFWPMIVLVASVTCNQNIYVKIWIRQHVFFRHGENEIGDWRLNEDFFTIKVGPVLWEFELTEEMGDNSEWKLSIYLDYMDGGKIFN